MLKLVLRGRSWHVQGTVKRLDGSSVRVRKSTGFGVAQRAEASLALSRVLEEVTHGTGARETGEALTVRKAVERFLARPEGVGPTDELVLRRLVGVFGDVVLRDLEQGMVWDHLLGRGNAPGTVAREVNSVNALLNHAKAMGGEVAEWRLKRPSVDDARERWLSEAERDRLIAACSEELRPVVVALFFTGGRLGEVLGLRWEDVVGGKAFFRTRKGRSKKTRVRAVPLAKEVLDVMGPRGEGLVFKRRDGSGWTRQSFDWQWRKARMEAGVTDFRAHDCRHTFASMLVQRGVSLRVVADLLGHSSLAMVMRYSHLAPSQLDDAVALLSRAG